MKSQITKSLTVAILLLLATRSLRAWQTAGGDAAGTTAAEDLTFVLEDSASNKSTKALPVPVEQRDSAFVWNVAFRAYRNQGGERDKLELSEEQASSFRSLCSEYSGWRMDFVKRRDTPDRDVSSHNQKMQKLHAEAYARMAKFREDFLAMLTDSQRDDVYRQTLKNGGAFALLHPELRTRFQLTDEQVKKISEIRDTNWEPLSPHFMTATDAHYRKKAEPFIAAAWEQLTDDQKAQFMKFVPDEPEIPRLAMKPSTPEDDAPPGYLDGTFLWNPATWRVSASNRPTSSDRPQRPDDLQLSEEQVAKVKTLSEEMRNELEELAEAERNAMIDRGGIELAKADQEKFMRWQQELNRTSLALKMKIGQAFMELLSDSQRNEMYRQSMLLGGAFALLEPSLREKFQLTETQVQALHKIRDENWHTLRTHFVSGNKPPFKRIETYLAAAHDQLTDDQKTQLEHFTAKPFIAQAVDAAAQSNDSPPGGLTEQVQATRESQGDTGHSLTEGTGGDVPPGNARQVSSDAILITWSKNNDELRGFSNLLGEWETLKIEKQDQIGMVLESNIAAVRIGDSVAAFSGVKGWWDVIALSKGSAAQPSISNDLLHIEDNGHLYTFAAAKGRWTSPTDPELQPIHDQIDMQANFKAVLLAEWPFQQWLESLPRYKARGVRAQFSGAGFVDLYVERRSLLDEARVAFSQALKRHEEIAAEKSPSPVSDVAAADKKIADLRRELQQLELAVRIGSGTNDSPDAKQDDQQRVLRNLVEKSFDLRQQMQRLEAQRMKLRLQLIETNLDARERARESIIDRRTEELISGAAGPTSTQTAAPRPELQDVELFFFTAAYCGPCQQVTPLLKRLQDEGFPITIVDISADPEATRRHKIDRIPTCVLKFDGVEVRRLVGLVSEAELRKELVRPAGKQQTSSVAVKSIPESNVDPKVSESSASISGSSGSTSRRERNVRTPAEFVAELRKLRQAVSEHSTTQKAAADSLAQISRPLAELKAEGLPYADWNGASRESFRKKLEQDLESKTIALDRANRDWQLGWSEYQSQLRMLQFDIDEAKLVMEQLLQKLDRVQQLFAKGAVPSTDVQEVESPLAIAKINVQRAEELLKLYADIETQEPQLNPDALKSEK